MTVHRLLDIVTIVMNAVTGDTHPGLDSDARPPDQEFRFSFRPLSFTRKSYLVFFLFITNKHVLSMTQLGYYFFHEIKHVLLAWKSVSFGPQDNWSENCKLTILFRIKRKSWPGSKKFESNERIITVTVGVRLSVRTAMNSKLVALWSRWDCQLPKPSRDNTSEI